MLITLEGIDGSGKSTQALLLHERLQASGRSCVLVREPGGTELSERIRALLLDPSLSIQPFAELLLFSAARAQLVRERIEPALTSGALVVCDRFFDSTTAYQGGGRMVADTEWLREFHARVTGGLIPDRTFLIRVDPGVALSRMEGRRGGASQSSEDRMEGAGDGFQRAVARAYDELAAADPGRIAVIDGHRSIEAIHDSIWDDLVRRIGLREETSIR